MRATSYVCNYARFHQELVDYSKQCEVPFKCTPHYFCLSSSAHLQKKYAFASKNFIAFGNHGAMTFVWPLCGKPYLLHATEPPRQTVNWLPYTIYSCATPLLSGATALLPTNPFTAFLWNKYACVVAVFMIPQKAKS